MQAGAEHKTATMQHCLPVLAHSASLTLVAIMSASISSHKSSLLLAGLLAFFSSSVAAQTSDKPAPPPPKMDKLEEGVDPNLRGNSSNPVIKQEPERKITERKVNGKVVEAKVKHGKSNYVLKPNEGHGNTMPGDAQSNQVRGAEWSVLEFGGDKKAKESSAATSSSSSASASSTAK